MSESPLYEDVHAAARFSSELAVRQSDADQVDATRLAAVERGRRQRPDGTVEDYERLEFDTR